MTELSEKDLNAIAEHVEEMTELDGIDNYDVVKAYYVERLLIQKDAEHKAEIEKLKGLHRKSVTMWRDAFEKMHQRAMRSEQSLAQHDKQVKIDIVGQLRYFIESRAVYLMHNGKCEYVAKVSDLDEYINQIKEQK